MSPCTITMQGQCLFDFFRVGFIFSRQRPLRNVPCFRINKETTPTFNLCDHPVVKSSLPWRDLDHCLLRVCPSNQRKKKGWEEAAKRKRCVAFLIRKEVLTEERRRSRTNQQTNKPTLTDRSSFDSPFFFFFFLSPPRPVKNKTQTKHASTKQRSVQSF